MDSGLALLVKAFGRPAPAKYPLEYPDPSGEFYGYNTRKIRLPDGTSVNSTRNLIRVTGWMATALIALQAGQYVARKRDCHTMYQQWIGDEWTPLQENIYTLCRGKWNYLIPQDKADQERLRAICARTLEFENHFLQCYRPFLLAEVQGADDQSKGRARWLMGQIPYDDAEIRMALQLHEHADGQNLQGIPDGA